MPEEITPQVETTTAPQGLSETEVKGIVSTALDEKLKDWKPQDLDAFKTEMLGEVGKMFESHKPEGASFDEQGFLSKLDGMIDSKLKGIGVPTKHVGPLSRWLGFS